MTPAVIHRVSRLDLRYEPWAWPFAEQRGAEISAHFEAMRRQKPELWNGRVLLARDAVFAGDRLSASYFDVEFASLLAWRDWGFVDTSVINGFGMGALRSADGAFVLGEMAQHTSNAGRIYFPAGTPDADDIRGDMVDLEGSVARELEEETGLTPSDYHAEPGWQCVVIGVTIAMLKLLRVDCSGEELKLRIEGNLARQSKPELSAVHLVRQSSDLSAHMPRFVTAFIEQQFAQSQ
jgi:8-oxo-dGTP pyrophosphatase MutT (NUDIX family)